MGFFGAIMGILGFVAVVSETSGNIVRNEEARQEAIEKGRNIYFNDKGQSFYVKDGKPAIEQYVNINGREHLILKYLKTNTIIRDYTEERLEKLQKDSKAFAEKIGGSVYIVGDSNYYRNDEIKGDRVRDIKTGDIYVIRNMGVRFYIDIKTGKYVRPTDDEIIHWRYKKKFDYYRYKNLYGLDFIDHYYLSRYMKYKITNEHTFPAMCDNEFFKEYTLPMMQELGMTKIYNEGETWEDIKEEFKDMGLPMNLSKQEKEKILTEIRIKEWGH